MMTQTTLQCLGSKDLNVTRSYPKLVAPAKPTPFELKPLSFLDNWDVIRRLTATFRVYRYNDLMRGMDPARVIRDALAQALVFYYPLAGRLKEGPDGRVSVQCTGEGIVFVEADADVELSGLGDPPFSCLDGLVCNNVSTFGGITDSHHLIYIQVTRMKCGGLVLGIHYNHAVSDAGGISQFLTAAGEIARGSNSPSITPVWCRHIFAFPDSTDRQEKKPDPIPQFKSPNIKHASFFSRLSVTCAICMLVPEHSRQNCTAFEILTAFFWKCHVGASRLDPERTVCLGVTCSGRGGNIPKGYYGNSTEQGFSETSARELCENSMEHAITLVKKAKEDGFKKLTGPTASRTRLCFSPGKSYLMVSDTRKLGPRATVFGWGEPEFAGPVRALGEVGTHFLPYRNRDGEDGVLALFCWPCEVIERFEIEVRNIVGDM